MKIVISGNVFGFPHGWAATNYVSLMAQGLVKAGSQVHIIVPHYTENQANFLNQDPSGMVNGVTFEYTTGTPILPANNWRRRFGKARSLIVTPWRLLTLKFYQPLNALILYGRSYSLLVRYSFWCRLFNIPLVVCIVEWTLANTFKEAEKQNKQRFYNEVFNHADAVIVISRYIEKLATEASRQQKKSLPCLRTSILGDSTVWQNIQPTILPRPYLLFCAYLDNYLDDALFVLEAVSKVQVADIDLLMVGKASRKTKQAIKNKIESLNLLDKVQLRSDYVSTDELYSLYAGAKALLAPLFNNERSLARFPSKIADYLMSGRPVVSSAIGEVGEYLEDGKTAFLSNSDTVTDFATKIEEALINNERSDLIGQEGKNLAKEQFNYLSRGEELLQFLNSLGSRL